MSRRSQPSRARSPMMFATFTFGACVAFGLGWLGCTTDNGTPGDEIITPSSSPDGSKGKDDGGTRPGFEAGFAEGGEGGSEGGDTCPDPGDPGSSEVTAKALPNTDDGVDDVTTVKGVVDGPVDVDFYKLSVEDTFSFMSADFQLATAGPEMCVFVRCKLNGETTVSGCTGGVLTTELGMKGCCATGPSSATPSWDCPGLTDNDSADFFIRIKQSGAQCTPYSFSYVF